jgi:hypothetical protein
MFFQLFFGGRTLQQHGGQTCDVAPATIIIIITTATTITTLTTTTTTHPANNHNSRTTSATTSTPTHLKTMPSEKGSRESTSSSSASPPSVIIWYISFSLRVMTLRGHHTAHGVMTRHNTAAGWRVHVRAASNTLT